MIVLPLTGGADVSIGGTTFQLAGREGVFSGVTDTAYLPIDSSGAADQRRTAATIALPGSRADRALPFRYQPASAVDVALRGSGSRTRQVNNFGMGTRHGVRQDAGHRGADPGVQLVVLPAAQARRGQRRRRPNSRRSTTTCSPRPPRPTTSAARDAKAVGYQRVYGTTERPIEVLEEVTDGDTVLVPHGWHGPCIASPSHHMYYLNVMAGPGDGRAWGISDDPEPRLGARDLGRPAHRSAVAVLHGTGRHRPTEPTRQHHCSVIPSAHQQKESSGEEREQRGRLGPTGEVIRLTVAQAVVKFLGQQYSERDGVKRKFFAGCFGIFGHGNVAGLGQALLQSELQTPGELPYHQGRNEQAMVHIAVGYARQLDRLQAFAVTASVGPGASNMLTGAALATINRLPVLLLPSDIFATRVSSPVLQELEQPYGYDVSVNDAFRPVSRFFDRVWRAEQLPAALLGAMRVLTDPAETGAATIALPEDVQAEAHDWPVDLFKERVWRIARPVPEPEVLEAVADLIRASSKPVIISGGGVTYAEANDALKVFVEATGIPIGETQAGKGSLPFDHPLNLGAVGATGNPAANFFTRQADLVIGIGTRYSDFTTASRTIFQNPDVKFININVASIDAVKHSGLPVQADAKRTLEALTPLLAGYSTDAEPTSRRRRRRPRRGTTRWSRPSTPATASAPACWRRPRCSVRSTR